MSEAERKAVRVRIFGRVQGVGFRDWAVTTARGLGLQGFVRNRRDGSVEALAVGPPAAVNAFLAACRRGPPLAQVTEVTEERAEGIVGPEFKQLPTA